MSTTPAASVPRVRGCCVPVAPLLPDQRVRGQADVHRALADPTRLQMLHLMRAAPGPVCVCDLTAAVGLAQATVSHHLARLRAAGIVASSRQGVWTYHRLRDDMPPAARAALELLEARE